MTVKKPTNTRRRVTRQTKARRPLPTLSRRALMTFAGTLGFLVGVLLCVRMLAEDASGGGRNIAVPLAMSARDAAIADAPKVESRGQSHTLREADIVSHDAIDLRRATVQGGRYVIDLPDGRRVTLTLEPELQQRVQGVLEKYKVPFGAFVAVNPQTGAVLALADHSEEKPGDTGFALRAAQPSASVFKIITSAALIEGEGVSPQKKVCYHGGLRGIAKEHIEDSPRYDTACRTLAQALAHSTNPIFAKLADRLLDRKELMGWAERFGYNAKIPFVSEVEPSRADLPTERVKYAASAAGFHHSSLSPLHGALIMAALGNEGRMMEPYLVEKVEKGGVTIFKAQPRELRRVVAAETATALLDMMALTTREGTAAKYFRKREPSLAGISIAAKTGSLSSTDAGVRHHNSWFVAAAPSEAPEIALAALVANAGPWRIKGTHLGKAGLEAYFGARKKTAQSGAPGR